MIGKEQSSLETKIECTKCQGLGIYNKVQLKREVRYEKTYNRFTKIKKNTSIIQKKTIKPQQEKQNEKGTKKQYKINWKTGLKWQ